MAGLETPLCLPGRAGGGSQGEGSLSICTEFADLSRSADGGGWSQVFCFA